ncbi:unnamed protein product [Tuber melanosporum]|uniref:(Perigord truffle) hypothetical protein n=1 Tax=Tuber melanosporum (strain Mel28) TaxID=656061 RepID=D5GKP4_TUBMM|nr:uncharacterized protein GSTUM_00009680001 [Tuber melanosporum]CAZ85087.1 unnamed protein product [Tuber melanosporum]
MLITASPEELPTPASNPPLPNHHNYPPAQPIEYTTDQNSDYFFRTNPSHPHYPVGYEGKLTYAPQIQEQDPDPNVNDFAHLPPKRHGNLDAIPGAAIPGDAGLGLHVCSICGRRFGRETDLPVIRRRSESTVSRAGPLARSLGASIPGNLHASTTSERIAECSTRRLMLRWMRSLKLGRPGRWCVLSEGEGGVLSVFSTAAAVLYTVPSQLSGRLC